MPATKLCPYCGLAFEPGARECSGCRFPDLDAPPEPSAPSSPPARPSRSATGRRKRPVAAVPRRAETCSHCGAHFPAGRPACPGCGSDAETGWKPAEEIDYAATDLPEEDPEAYREALLGERPGNVTLWGARRTRNLVVGALLLAAMIVPLLIALRHLG